MSDEETRRHAEFLQAAHLCASHGWSHERVERVFGWDMSEGSWARKRLDETVDRLLERN